MSTTTTTAAPSKGLKTYKSRGLKPATPKAPKGANKTPGRARDLTKEVAKLHKIEKGAKFIHSLKVANEGRFLKQLAVVRGISEDAKYHYGYADVIKG
jgi:hypothetical protein